MRLDLSSRTDGELLREFSALVERDHRSTAELIVYVSEIQARRLFAPLGYSSMYKYCVHELHMSEDVAWKRTAVAKLARRFPVIFELIADGRLHLTAVVKLLPYRNAKKFPELLEASVHKTKSEIELLLAERFPQPDVPAGVRPLVTSAPCQKLVPEPVVQTPVPAVSQMSIGGDHSPAMAPSGSPVDDLAKPGQPEPSDVPAAQEPGAGTVQSLETTQVSDAFLPAGIQPLAPQRFAVGQATHDLMRRAQDLLGRQVPPGDLEQLLARAFGALVRQLEHTKFAATEKPRRGSQRSTAGKRHVPASVKRAVHERDGGRCTFVSDSGHRCDERRDLQYDHIEPFARGGEATLKSIRLLCPAHNQLEAERVYGAGFMEAKRKAAG